MLQDCKYRLPCNWCDKYDRMCEAVLFEIHKQQEEKNVGKQKPNECEHEWRFELKYQFPEEPERWYNKYFCPKCGSAKVQVEDVII